MTRLDFFREFNQGSAKGFGEKGQVMKEIAAHLDGISSTTNQYLHNAYQHHRPEGRHVSRTGLDVGVRHQYNVPIQKVFVTQIRTTENQREKEVSGRPPN